VTAPTGARGGRITAPRTTLPTRTAVDLFLVAGAIGGLGPEQAVRRALEYGVAAERAGFDGAWIAEHHFISYGGVPSAVAFAGHLLGRTTRLTVGTAACVLSTRHPVALAEEAVLLDALSGGRFQLGVARGGPWVDLEVFGTGLSRYSEGFPDSLDLLLHWLSGQQTVAGNHTFPFRTVRVVPRPDRPLPIWVAATSKPTVELAASHRLPLLTGMHATDNEKRALIDLHGDSTLDHASAHLAYVADTQAEATNALRDAMPEWLASTREYVRIDGSAPKERDLGAYLDRLLAIHPVGPPDLCRERLAATIATTGVKRILLMVEGAGDPGRTRANIERLGAEVIPQLNRDS
jgi:alkanesulfonate monooxygenase SsuD/methylene tetrahydromethanopterin reductase-like flavin-dependent oxidoreductase (luciferase family)